MTEVELLMIVGNKDCSLVEHENMRDVAFWPTKLEFTMDNYKLTGFWYSNIFEDLMGDNFGNPLKETITIKKDDLVSWQIRKTTRS